jgi:hypothetical protein
MDEVLDDISVSYKELGCTGPIRIINDVDVRING